MFLGHSEVLDERYERKLSSASGTQAIHADIHRYRCEAPRFIPGAMIRPRNLGRYTIRFSPAERQAVVDGMVHVTRKEGRDTSLDERAVSR